ncbi:MAG: sugar phosphate isomerase/epimerase [Candidatus Sumerlaeaceae bacterium]|nr:sugar phosphate isomerase/epimerase [Candidatus Sumerlaeaceae bacterium]
MMVQVGLQLYTVRHAFAGDLSRTLEAVAEIGYKVVELAGFGNMAVRQLRDVLCGLGIKAVSSHVPLESIRRDFPRVVAEAQELGCQYIAIPSPPENVTDHEGDWRFLREELRFYASQFSAAGLQLCYHNHAREFSPLDTGLTPFEILFAKEEPYALQLDVYWASFANYSPEEILTTVPAGCPTIHVKDMTPPPIKEDTVAGAGILDWNAIFTSAMRKGVVYFLVEVDNPQGDPLVTAARGYQFCQQKLHELLTSA